MQRMQICNAQNVPGIPSELLKCPMQVCKVIFDIVQNLGGVQDPEKPGIPQNPEVREY